MKRAQAEALQVTWRQRIDSLPCEHLEQETGSDDAGYWTGNYYCSACGELIVHRPDST